MKLSILICTLENRSQYLNRILSILNKQKTDEVEIITNLDNGEKSVGTKRNELLKMATGEYICFVDDDDTVSDDYISSILNCIEKNPDAVGIELNYYHNRALIGIAYHSIKNNGWWQRDSTKEGYTTEYYRFINHLNPVKRELAMVCMFPEQNTSEDLEYSKKLFQLIKSEEYINRPIYNYYYNPLK